jgi:hypothetical protein
MYVIVVVQTEESYRVNKPENKTDCPQIIQSVDIKVSCDHHTYIPRVEFMFPLRLGQLDYMMMVCIKISNSKNWLKES